MSQGLTMVLQLLQELELPPPNLRSNRRSWTGDHVDVSSWLAPYPVTAESEEIVRL